MSNKRCKTPSYISEQVLTNILVKLPVKSLVRFMCVSKSWGHLIPSSSFVSAHLMNARKHAPTYLVAFHQNSRDKRKIGHSLFCNETFEQYLELRLPSENGKHFGIYGSSNGLLCISTRILVWRSQIEIWNPSVRKIRILPLIGLPQHPGAKYDIGLSFGFHPELNDYKVVRMLHFGQRVMDSFTVAVYSFSTNSWWRIGVIPDWLKCPWQYLGCEFWNGIAYWLIMKDSIVRIVSLDTDSEKFEEVVVPNTSSSRNLCIKVYKESICLLQVFLRRDGKKQVNLWAMQEGSFEKLCFFVIYGEGSLPLCFRTDNELFVEDGDYRDGMADLVLYTLQSNQVQVNRTGIRLVLSRYGGLHFGSLYNCSANSYVESLILLNDGRNAQLPYW